MITNATCLGPGDELILPVTIEAKEKAPLKRTWQTVLKEETKRCKRGAIEKADGGRLLSERMAEWESLG